MCRILHYSCYFVSDLKVLNIYILALENFIKDKNEIYFLTSLNVFSLLPLCSVNK